MRKALIEEKQWFDEELPCENTIGNIMNRLGYRLRRVQKARPIKKVRETDAIFENVHKENQASDERADSLRISIDSKAKVDIGNFFRGGQSRGKKPVKADDHDMDRQEKLIPIWYFRCLSFLVDNYFWYIMRDQRFYCRLSSKMVG